MDRWQLVYGCRVGMACGYARLASLWRVWCWRLVEAFKVERWRANFYTAGETPAFPGHRAGYKF